jgi:ATP-dependent Clp protease ATP-binding subunit ClpC
MYERFTDCARKAMGQAAKLAQSGGNDHLGTEHILLGIVEADASAAVQILKKLNVDVPSIREQIEKTVQRGPMPSTRRRPPLSARAKKIIEYAMTEARDLEHNSIGTEHLLLGLIRVEEEPTAAVLKSLGVRLDDVRREAFKWPTREPQIGNAYRLLSATAAGSRFGPRSIGRLFGRAIRAFGRDR